MSTNFVVRVSQLSMCPYYSIFFKRNQVATEKPDVLVKPTLETRRALDRGCFSLLKIFIDEDLLKHGKYRGYKPVKHHGRRQAIKNKNGDEGADKRHLAGHFLLWGKRGGVFWIAVHRQPSLEILRYRGRSHQRQIWFRQINNS